jgi:hypothetical protein
MKNEYIEQMQEELINSEEYMLYIQHIMNQEPNIVKYA